MEFRILGPLEVLDGEKRLPLGGAKRRAVLALLLLDANRVVSLGRLVDRVWDDEPPAGAQASLQNHVLRLRRELGERIVTRAPGYLLRVEPDELDLERFRRLVDESRSAAPEQVAALLRQALALWRGPPLADLAREPVASAAAGLDELRLEALELRIEADLAQGRHAELVSELEALVGEQPFRERLRAQLMLALYRSGRQADALDAFAAARTAFDDELGLDLAPELHELQRAILRHDPSLDAPALVTERRRTDAVEEARKTVTLLVAELHVGAEDPEARREELRRARTSAAATIEAHGGTLGEPGDDRLLGIFGVPTAHEDDALRAARAACDLREADLLGRAAIATGAVITGDPGRGRPLVSGPPLQEADRLLASAAERDVQVGERTWRLVRHAVVRGASPRSIERVLPDAEAVVRRLETPLVGRADELGELFAAFQLAATNRHARLVTVLGSPGVGKTRLAREFVDVLSGSAICAIGRTPSGEDSTYAPLRDAFSTLAQGSVGPWAASVLAGAPDGDAVAVRVAAAAGEASSSGPVEETAWAVRRLLETLARERPVVLVIEDVHDASSVLLDLVEHVATLAQGPILLVVLARPELLDSRPDWGGGVRGASILLDVLPSERAGDLLDNLAAASPLALERREAILDAAAGNPLFLEQLLAASEDDDVVPDSIHALLAARLDRLGDVDRRVLQAAAVFGLTFTTGLVQALVDTDARRALVALSRRDFVEPDIPDPFGSESWIFRHALVRDEAYATLPKRRRAELHEQVAAFIEASIAQSGMDASEVIGYHLESAYRAASDVDPRAPELGRLAAGAARHLEAAGRRALDERDMGTSADLLSRALALRSPRAPERVDLAVLVSDCLSWMSRRDEAFRVLDEAERHVGPSDERARARLLLARLGMRQWGPDPGEQVQALAEVRQAMSTLEEAGDHEGLAYAHLVAYHASERLSTGYEPERELALAVEHARAAGARGIEGVATSWLCVHVRHGPLPVDEAKERMLRILDDPPSRYARASALGGLADLRAMEGAFDEARALVAENHSIIEELGLPQTAAADLIAVSDVEFQAGDYDAAERLLHESLDRLGALGGRFGSVNAAWRLARVLVRQGRDEEAEPYVAQALAGGGGEGVLVWGLVLDATRAARRGDSEHASSLLELAAQRLDSLAEGGMHVDAFLQMADVSELLGRHDEAADRLRRAAALAERLGYLVAARAAAERLAQV